METNWCEVVCKDCLQYLHSLIDRQIKVNLVLCDPPFKPFHNQGYHQVHDEIKNKLNEIPTPSEEKYDDWWRIVCQLCSQILTKDGWFIWKSDAMTAKAEFYPTQDYFDYVSERIWDKGRIGLGYYIRNQHEHIELYRPKNSSNNYLKHRPGRHKNHKQWHGSSQDLCLSSMHYFKNFNDGTLGKTTKQQHINETPFEFWEEYIDWFCPSNGIVCDPFMGSGSIGKAIKHLNQKPDTHRFYYACELVEKNYILAESQLNPNTILTQLTKSPNSLKTVN